ncbi:hypothetical protein BD324DRAFT_634481 [Kockovaella imperatae]|uniref:Uncharacterized protein n=1 Tax=Kockovaella imperatae TaxID=4999 RepID=A0A1Y1UAW2_9TREE|nr:hypothetical protein BD324DRAFT_634481 [Kockovaella imperatae]ORX34684.1 hypothetical protein BD324DRAFT_634481 [Kockovaella imperatae]
MIRIPLLFDKEQNSNTLLPFSLAFLISVLSSAFPPWVSARMSPKEKRKRERGWFTKRERAKGKKRVTPMTRFLQ